MKRKATEAPETPSPSARRPRISTKYPGLRTPPQRKRAPPTPVAFTTPFILGSSHFERLPPEIRNQIYELVLVDTTKPTNVRHAHYFESGGRTMHALTQVSRAVRAECVRMWYARNMFRFASLMDLGAWMGVMGKDVASLRKIELADGVIEGRHYPFGNRDFSAPGKPKTRTDFTYRITPGMGKPTFTTGYAIHPNTREAALERLGMFAKPMYGKLEQGLVVVGTIPHCSLCATGANWGCGGRSWWES